MADEHPNAGRVRALFRAFEQRDLEAIAGAFADDAVWRFPGRKGKVAGDHRGHEGIFTFLANVSELTGCFAATARVKAENSTIRPAW